MSDLPSGPEERCWIASTPLVTTAGAFSTATFVPKDSNGQSSEGIKGTEGKASIMAKGLRGHGEAGREQSSLGLLLFPSVHRMFSLFTPREAPQTAYVRSSALRSRWRGFPGGQEAKKQLRSEDTEDS